MEQNQLKEITLYTDGACSGNPGPGGWAAVLIYGEHQKEISGFWPSTTNNRMELMAAIKGLAELKQPCAVTVHSDSTYLVHAIEQHWLDNWMRNGWKTAAKQPVENKDLWQLLMLYMRKHRVSFVKVPGHANNALNNRCDALARAAIQTGLAERRNPPESAEKTLE